MSFYGLLMNYYDDIFPLNPVTLNFLQKHFQKHHATRILDLACGSGNYSTAMAEKGFDVTGLDLDENMIELAKKKIALRKESKEAGLPHFVPGNMLYLSKHLREKFHGVFCIGNSLVHLDSDEKLKTGLNEAAGILKPGGVLIIQIVNYDRILEQNIKELPPIVVKNKKVVFRRLYQYDKINQVIHFTGELSVEGKGSFRETVPLIPLRREKLHAILVDTGFTGLHYWGTFSEEPWKPDSSATIVKATLSGN